MTVVANIPVWVFPLFVLLVVVGLRATRDRTVPQIVMYLLPLLGVLTLRNVLSLSPPLWIWLLAALSYATGTWFGMRWQRGWIIARHGIRIHLKGEWLTFTAMMVLFAAGFAKGFASETMPEIAHSIGFAAIFTIIVSLPAGQFLGRAITCARTPLSHTA